MSIYIILAVAVLAIIMFRSHRASIDIGDDTDEPQKISLADFKNTDDFSNAIKENILTRKPTVVQFKDLAHLWRKVEEQEVTLPIQWLETPEFFRHEEINIFYLDKIYQKPFFHGPVNDAIIELLQFLDKFGDCSSLTTGIKNKNELTLAPDTMAILANVPLYIHALNTAHEAIRSLQDKELLIPRAVIAALAHDLGKVPHIYERYHLSGTHAFASAVTIEGLPAVRGLTFFAELKEAVRLHHSAGDEMLAKLLREADHGARRKEVADFLLASIPELNTQASEFQRLRTPNEIVATPWLEPDRFLTELAAELNRSRLSSPWTAISMRDYVYFHARDFFTLVVRHAGPASGIRTTGLSEKQKRCLCYSVYHELSKIGDVTATEFVGKGFYGAKFLCRHTDDKETELYLVPFRLEAFARFCDIKEMESRKTACIKQVLEIRPSYKKRHDVTTESATPLGTSNGNARRLK